MAPGGRPAGGGRRDRAGWDYQQFLSHSYPPAVHGLAYGKRAGAWEHTGHRGARSGTRWVGAGVPARPAVTAQTLAFMRIVVSGYYGFGNGGDEAVLEAIVGALRARIPQAHVVVLSAAPDQTKSLHGVAGVSRTTRARRSAISSVSPVPLASAWRCGPGATEVSSNHWSMGCVRPAGR